jgi:hypothetical protein
MVTNFDQKLMARTRFFRFHACLTAVCGSRRPTQRTAWSADYQDLLFQSCNQRRLLAVHAPNNQAPQSLNAMWWQQPAYVAAHWPM